MKKTLAILLSLTLIICMMPSYTGAAFAGTIDYNLANATVTVNADSLIYDGTAKTPTFTVVDSGGNQVPADSYTFAYENNTDAGTDTASVTITGKASAPAEGEATAYYGEKTKSFSIGKLNLTNASVKVSPSTALYSTSIGAPSVTVTYGGKTISSDNYTVSDISTAAAGESTFTVTGKVNAEGTKDAKFVIEKIDLTKASADAVTLSTAEVGSITGKGTDSTFCSTLKNKITVKQSNTVMDTSFYDVVSYEVNTNVTNVRAYIKANSSNVGTANLENADHAIFVDIAVKKEISDAEYEIRYTSTQVAIPDQEYTGAARTPSIGVYHKTTNAKLDPSYYNVTYSNNTYGGQNATVTVTGKGEYSGSIYANFAVSKKDISSSGITVTGVGTAVAGDYPKAITVKFGSALLVEGTDYAFDIATLNSTTAGSLKGEINIKGKGNFDGTRVVKFDVANYDIDDATVSASYFPSVPYRAAIQKPSFSVMYNSQPLTENSHYTVEYRYFDKNGNQQIETSPKNAGVYSIYLIGKYPTYGGEKYVGVFTITAVDISNCDVTASQANPASALTVSVKSKYENVPFVQGVDFAVTPGYSYGGKGYATVTPVEGSNLTGTAISVTYSVASKNLSSCTAEFATGSKQTYQYTGSSIKPSVVVRDGYTALTLGTHYTITYKDTAGKVVTNPIETGTYQIVIEGKGDYTGSKVLTFYIQGTDISAYTVTLSKSLVTATGLAQNPSVSSVKYGYTSSLTANDYTVTFQDASGKEVTSVIYPGTYKVVVTGKNGYQGSTYALYTVKGLAQTMIIDKTSFKVYEDSDIFKINAKVTGDGTITYTSMNPSVATVSASGVVTVHKVGRAVIKVQTTNNVKYDPVEDEVYVKVYPDKAKISKKPWTDGKKGQMKVRWEYQDGVTKYQVRYATASSFKSYKTKTVAAHGKDLSTQSTTIKNLSSNKTYYFKVRAVYETYNENGTKITYYGTWSNWRSAKTK